MGKEASKPEENSNDQREKKDTNVKTQKVFICASCAKNLRGKFKISRFAKTQNFSCFIGKSKEKSLKQFDGFKFLHNKVDLSAQESLKSFQNWHSKYLSLREASNAKLILSELSSAKTSSGITIRLCVFRNGNGRTRGEMIMGRSIQTLLDLATERLQLTTAARRFYTEDGTQILDAQDLIKWASQYYRKMLETTGPSNGSQNSKPNKLDSSRTNTSDQKETDYYQARLSSLPNPTRTELERIFLSRVVDERKLLRWPIEVWVSCGEQFVPPLAPPAPLKPEIPSNASLKKNLQRKNDVKKSEQNQNLSEDIKNPTLKEKKSEPNVRNPNLHLTNSVTKRVKVYLNGETQEKAQLVWASSIEELQEEAKKKLGLNKPIKYFFTSDGKPIAKFEELSRDQIICGSNGRDFITPEMKTREATMKITWNKVRKEEGLQAVKITIDPKKNPMIDVDPFSSLTVETAAASVAPLALTEPPKPFTKKEWDDEIDQDFLSNDLLD